MGQPTQDKKELLAGYHVQGEFVDVSDNPNG